MERLPALAADMVRLGVDVIVTGNTPNTVAAMKATTTIPIVMTNSADPVSAGLVTSLARPGGNVTGFAQDTGGETHAKRLELLWTHCRTSREWAFYGIRTLRSIRAGCRR